MASKIQLTPAILQSQAKEMNDLKEEFSSLFSGVTSELRNINSNWSPNLANNFLGKITSAQKTFSEVTTMLGNGATVANNCATSFASVDSELSKLFSGDVVNKAGNLIVDNAGTAGGIISAIRKIIEGATSDTVDVGGIAKGSKSLISGIYNMYKNVGKLEKLSRMNPGQAVKTGFKRFFGLDKAFTGSLLPSTAKGFGTRFYNNFQKQWSKGLEGYTTKGAKGVLAWAGVAVSAVANGFQNYDEAKSGDISAGRAVAETITETAVDVGTGLLVGAAVSAGIAAAGFVSAPAIAVGAATAGVMVGLDAVCKWATKSITGEEKGFTETVSDFVLDTGETVVKHAKAVTSSVVKGVSNMAKSAGSFFKKIF
jgi:uncharacterized protein YukE